MGTELDPLLVTRVAKFGQTGSLAKPSSDRLVLDADQRASPHFTARTELGRKLHISLERGTELEDRDVLIADDGYAVAVIAANEELIAVEPGELVEDWGAICYQLGNLHRAIKIAKGEILTPKDAQVEAFLVKIGAKFRCERRPFVGRRFGSVGGHHH